MSDPRRVLHAIFAEVTASADPAFTNVNDFRAVLIAVDSE
jgi:hypothetical protein